MSPTRRDFLKTSVGASTLLSLAPAVPTFLARTAAANAGRRDAADTVLVVLQLAGGNDGLNTVVPYGDDEYAKCRSTLRLPAGQLHKIDDLLGFHPRMQGFARLLKEGHLSVVQGVGYPNPHGGHFESMRIWQTACPERFSNCQTGWLGRAVDGAYEPASGRVPALYLGEIERPFALNAQKAIIPAIRSLDQCLLRPMLGAEDAAAHGRRLARSADLPRSQQDNPMLAFVQRTSLAAVVSHRQIEAVADGGAKASTADYPSFALARMLRAIAQLIRADQGIRIFFTELGGQEPGGFDNHANQRDNHAALLHHLSESVTAFVADLQRDKLLDRVLLMTFSEFGRTVHENGRRGTDHGSAAPVFLVGGRVKGGLVGAHPNLTQLENGGQKFHTDFRRVYATALEHWLGFDSQPVLGQGFPPLDLLEGAARQVGQG